jgi:tetratricopeptide (TPR) repeat protein
MQPGSRDEPDSTPERLGDYVLEHRLGAGAMGEVFAARHAITGERVALKRLVGVEATSLVRFKREFRALADVAHPNLVRLGDLVIVAEGPAFFTMELVDGEVFDDYVRRRTPPGEAPNLVRLIRAFRQLVAGVAHLHRVGTLHRDLKPSNVMVTREGRVVILDFGLISQRAEPGFEISGDGQILGTPAYMAPEQTNPGPFGPAIDLYALGVILYLCLTGRLPFGGSPLQMMIDKQRGKVPDPCAIVPALPAQLGALCVRLLAVDPTARPGCDAVLEQLAGSTTASGGLPVGSLGRMDVFVGRERELAVLEAGLAATRDDNRAATVLVRGPSGIGKSTLIARFLAPAIERSDALVLRGRCFERESVPFKGVDAVIDALSVFLRRLPDVDSVRYQPRRVGALIKLFPVLADAWPSRRHREVALGDLQHVRRLGVAALREVLTRIADDRPLVIHVEDFQWADVDGARLLTELTRPPEAPPMLLIVSFRDDADSREAVRELISTEALAERHVERIELEPLSDSEATTLARALVAPSSDEAEQRLEQQTRRAKGSPFFLRQLLSETASSDPAASFASEGSLDAVVARRIVQLPARTRRMLAIIAVAAGPLAEAAALELEPTAEAIVELAELGLIRREQRESATFLEASHDRIREVMVAELDTAELRDLHARLGNVLAGRGAPPERLAEHFERGGDPIRALHYVELAAAQAAAGLGFARATELYRRALMLARETSDPSRRERLEAALADQLSNLGRSAEAAELFLGLVPLAREPLEVMTLRRQAIDHLIKSGQIDRGLDVLESALAAFGEGLPRRPWPTILSFLRHRLRLLVRGSKFTVRTADQLDPRTIEYLATVLAGTLGLMSQEMLTTTALHARLLRAALDAGEPYHLACGLMWEMVLWINGGFDRRARKLRQRVRKLANESDDPMVLGIAATNEASYSYMSRHWANADAEWTSLLDLIDDIPRLGWLRAMRTFSVHSKLALGSFAALRQIMPEWTQEASESGVQQSAAEMLALSGLVELFTGDIDVARRLIAEGRSLWHMPRYTFPEFYLDVAELPLRLALGEYARAAEQIERSLIEARRWQVHRIVLAHDDLLDLHARSFALLALHGGDARARRRARASARGLARVNHPTSKARAAVVRAALAETRERSAEHWRVALHHFDACGMRGHRAAVGIRLARIGKGEAAERLRSEAEAYFVAEGIREPERLIDVLAPAPAWVDRSA